jgi:hypothetical protein
MTSSEIEGLVRKIIARRPVCEGGRAQIGRIQSERADGKAKLSPGYGSLS